MSASDTTSNYSSDSDNDDTQKNSASDIVNIDPTKFKIGYSKSTISYNKYILTRLLEMLSKRRGYDDVRNVLLPSLLKHTSHITFQAAMISGTNVLRNALSLDNIREKYIPSLRTLMSFMTVNSVDPGCIANYTAVFFADLSGKTQIPKSQIKVISRVLLLLETTYNITEVIIVAPAPFSHDSDSHLKIIKMNRFLQIFRDTELLIDPTESVWTADIDRVVKEKDVSKVIADEFETPHISSIKQKLLRISHLDVQLKYIGVRPGELVFLTRKPLVPSGLVTREKTFALVY